MKQAESAGNRVERVCEMFRRDVWVEFFGGCERTQEHC